MGLFVVWILHRLPVNRYPDKLFTTSQLLVIIHKLLKLKLNVLNEAKNFPFYFKFAISVINMNPRVPFMSTHFFKLISEIPLLRILSRRYATAFNKKSFISLFLKGIWKKQWFYYCDNIFQIIIISKSWRRKEKRLQIKETRSSFGGICRQ